MTDSTFSTPTSTERPAVVIIDDSKLKQNFLKSILKDSYTVHTFSSEKEALPQLPALSPSCFLMDMERPGEDSVTTIKRIRAIPGLSQVPIVMITSTSDTETEQRVLECGCDDYVGNRFSPDIIRTRVTHLVELFGYRRELERRVEEKTRSIMELQDAIMLMLSDLVECRDSMTSGHARRTRAYVQCLIDQMLQDGCYTSELSEDFIRDIVRAAPLHDIGKVGIADAILNKPGRLNTEEFEEMKRHTILGAQAILHAINTIEDNSFLRVLRDVAFSHHERWDGSGYPLGLQGRSIPLSGRIMAIPDVYDALVSARPYKQPFSHEKATSIIKEGIGSHFDPLIGAAFLKREAEFQHIAASLEQSPLSSLRAKDEKNQEA